MKLGKLDPKYHPKTLDLLKYFPKLFALPAPPPKKGWEYAVPDETWAGSMLGNDQYGDCVEAMALHYIMGATAQAGTPVTFTTQDALDLYTAITGFNPNDPSTDNGTAITDLLNYWQTTGIKGHFINGWASVPINATALNTAIWLFGGVLIGTSVVQSMMDQFDAGQPWNAPFTGDVLGGHGIPILGYGSAGRTCITWGKRQPMDLSAPSLWDEAYVVITDDWLNQASGLAPSGFNYAALQADLQAIGQAT